MPARRIGVHLYFAPSFGGGERYLLTAAEALAEIGEVDFVCRSPDVNLESLAAHFGLDLSRVRSVHRPERSLHGFRDWLGTRPYDLFLALDNHLAPMQISLGRRGILHLQTPPYPPPFDRPMRNRLRLRSYDVVLCNSEYTRRFAAAAGTAGLPTRVVHPPIEVALYRPLAKKPVILSVGRFFVGRHQKNHTLLIETFRRLMRGGLAGWELHLLGSVRRNLPADVAYLEELRAAASGLPIHFHVDASLEDARRLYGEASLYWHAAGYGVDEGRNPQHLEHFGMAIVEAMSAGAVPIVFGHGGPLEIVEDRVTGLFWREPAELERLTLELATSADESRQAIGERARRAAQRFGKARFAEEIRALARELLDGGGSLPLQRRR